MTTQAQLTLKETHVDETYGRVFEGWMSGDVVGIFGDLYHTHCAMTSGQAIAHKVAVEKVAFTAGVNVEVVFDFLP
jgi:hypothetical protein